MKIPKGWKKVAMGQRIEAGDKYWNFTNKEYQPVFFSIGRMNNVITMGNATVIRKLPALPRPKDKPKGPTIPKNYKLCSIANRGMWEWSRKSNCWLPVKRTIYFIAKN
jgi:hypothetical protein